ncbi:MAG: hypothetical protein WC570_04110 [Patescibacteria group bacterium]
MKTERGWFCGNKNRHRYLLELVNSKLVPSNGVNIVAGIFFVARKMGGKNLSPLISAGSFTSHDNFDFLMDIFQFSKPDISGENQILKAVIQKSLLCSLLWPWQVVYLQYNSGAILNIYG